MAIEKDDKIKNLQQKKSLKDVVEDIFLGLSLSRQPLGDMKRIPTLMVNAKDLQSGFLPNRENLQESEVPEGSQIDRFRLQVGDVVMTARGTIKVAGVSEEQAGAIAGANLIIVRPGEWLAAPLVLAFLRHPSTLAILARLSVGTTVPSINVGAVAGLEVVLPSSERQTQLSQLVELADEHFSSARRAAELRHMLAQEVAMKELAG